MVKYREDWRKRISMKLNLNQKEKVTVIGKLTKEIIESVNKE